jgi:hypothetical protein
MSLSGITHGASLGIFSMGLFLPWVNSKVSSKLQSFSFIALTFENLNGTSSLSGLSIINEVNV